MSLLTTTQLAQLLSVSRSRAVALCARGRIPAVKFGSQWQIDQQDALAYRDSPDRKPGKRKRGPRA